MNYSIKKRVRLLALHFFMILLSLNYSLHSQSESTTEEEEKNKNKSETEKLYKDLDDLDDKREAVKRKIQELENKANKNNKIENGYEQKMNEEAFFKLEDTIVTTVTKREQKITDAPSAIYVITDKQIRERGYRWLSDALQDIPGFDIQHTYGQYPILFHQRGIVGNNQRTLFYIDGIPEMGISEQSVRAGNTQFPLQNVKRIEILAGPAAALHGSSAFSGTINIITKDGKGDPGSSVDFMYGAWESGFRNPGYAANFSTRGRGRYDGSFQYSVNGYFYKTQGPNFGQNGHLDKRNIDPNDVPYAIESKACGGVCLPDSNSVGYYWSPKYTMSATDTYNVTGKFSKGGFRFQSINWQYQQGAGTTNNGTFVSDFHERGYETGNYDDRNNARLVGGLLYKIKPNGSRGSVINTRQNSVSSGYLYRFNEKLNLDSELTIRQTDVISSTFNENLNKSGPNSEYRPGEFTLATFSRPDFSYASKQTLQYNPNPRLSTTAGLELSYFNMPRGNSPITAVERFEIKNTGIYLQQTYRPIQNLNFTAGYRYDYNTVFHHIHTPRLAAVFSLTKDFTIKALAGAGFRAPTGQEMFAASAGRKINPNLKPERLKSLELGFGYRFLNKYYLSVMSYYSTIADIIIDAETAEANPGRPGTRFTQNQNIGGAKIYGTEVSNDIQVTDKFKIFFNYTFNRGVYTDILGATPSTRGRTGDDYAIDLFNKVMKTNAVPDTGPIPVIAPHKANIGFTYYLLPKLSFHFGLNYMDVRRNPSTNPVKIANSYVMGKLNIRWEDFLYEGLFVQMQVYNLANEQYFDPGFRNGNGQAVPTLLPLERRNIWFTVGYIF